MDTVSARGTLSASGPNVRQSRKYFEEKNQFVQGEDLQKVNLWLFELGEIILMMKGNATVLESLQTFYEKELLQEIQTLGDGVSWLEDRACHERIHGFVQQLKQIIHDTDLIIHKAEQIFLRTENREKYVSYTCLSLAISRVMFGKSDLDPHRCKSSCRTK
jgi:hypothetical protein